MPRLMEAVKFVREAGQLPPSGVVNFKDLLNRFRPSPSNSIRALLLKMFSIFPIGSEVYEVVPMFWGNPFPRPSKDPRFPYTPYSLLEFVDAIRSIDRAGYFSYLLQYGAGQVNCSSGNNFTDEWPDNGNATYVSTFTVDDVITFIKNNLSSVSTAEGSVPIYCVVIPSGSLLDVGALGAHSSFQMDGKNILWFWMYASNNIGDASKVATHEIVETIGADFGFRKELCDDCGNENPDGRVINGLRVETYFDNNLVRALLPAQLVYSFDRPVASPPGTGRVARPFGLRPRRSGRADFPHPALPGSYPHKRGHRGVCSKSYAKLRIVPEPCQRFWDGHEFMDRVCGRIFG